MRDIKFRAKLLEGDKFVYGYLFKNEAITRIIPNHAVIDEEDVLDEYYTVNYTTVGQYTGLKDKNGVEIYEGDILENINGKVRVNNEWVPNKEISIVVWEDAAFALKSPGSEAIDWAHSSYYLESIVIGNIHSNPELLS